MGIFSVLEVINAIGPCAAGPAESVYAWIEFTERGGKVRRVGNVIAGAEIGRLVERDAIGAWYLHEVGGSHRILGIERADGPRAIDFDAVYACIPHWLAELRASRPRVSAH